MPERSISPRTRAIAVASAVVVLVTGGVIAAIVSGGDPDQDVINAARPADSSSPATTSSAPPAQVTVATTIAPTPSTAVTTTQPAAAVTAPPPVEVLPPAPASPPSGGGVLFSTSFDTPGTALDNGMLLPGMGPHITPRPGVVANGAIFRDPAMTEWEDVLVRAPVGPLTGDRYIEAVVTVASNGTDAHPAIMFFDDPGTTSGGCAGGSTMDWAEVDPWNNMQVGRISFVVNGCYDATTHVFAEALDGYQTYTVRAEIVGGDIVMKVNGTETTRTAIPAGLDLPFAGLRLGQFGVDGGFDQYRIESFEVGQL